MAEGGSNDGGDDNIEDDVDGGDGKRKVGCGEESNDDGSDDNASGSVDDDGGVDVN